MREDKRRGGGEGREVGSRDGRGGRGGRRGGRDRGREKS